ncbi:dihydrolipoamide acetyltransferase family protein [Priestia flexa]|uniref:dihydrolipoamide acetyltransferase family protein n=1 Tax=Priestia flexa TaxID=86664 RepID=UPI00240D77AE|nr:dihydrolipoamide acetyltransferase family protein [Priestia flexa]WEZ09655.1 dihydrolipoamide acetyltransferase family protein [Priestia flexa]
MAIEKIKMPQLGESVTEGTISKWLVAVGDQVNKYDPLAEVMTDKVNAEVPSSFTGVIKEIIAAEDETLPVGETLCLIEVEGASSADTAQNAPKETNEKVSLPNTADQSNKKRYSPAVLRLSQEHGINLETLTGSGGGGRITRKDVLAAIEKGPQRDSAVHQEAPKTAPASSAAPSPKAEMKKSEPIPTASGDKAIPVSGVRKAIASNMLRSKHEIPHAWTMVEVDVTSLVAYRDSIKTEFKQKEGFNLTYFAFFVKAIAQALTEFPEINSMWAGDEIIQKKDINISIAVATDDALFVPVIKNADEKTIKGIAREINELAQKVRAGSLKAADMQGGTFTVNNTGSFGSVQSMGIINYPQAAILQVESIVKRPVVINNMIAIRDMVNLCLSLDHRVLDGLVCGRFLKRIKEILESMSKEHTSIY